jgi:hypothetical protein
MIIVLDFPNNELDNNLVSFESLKGICVLELIENYFLLDFASLLITFESTKRLLLM